MIVRCHLGGRCQVEQGLALAEFLKLTLCREVGRQELVDDEAAVFHSIEIGMRAATAPAAVVTPTSVGALLARNDPDRFQAFAFEQFEKRIAINKRGLVTLTVC